MGFTEISENENDDNFCQYSDSTSTKSVHFPDNPVVAVYSKILADPSKFKCVLDENNPPPNMPMEISCNVRDDPLRRYFNLQVLNEISQNEKENARQEDFDCSSRPASKELARKKKLNRGVRSKVVGKKKNDANNNFIFFKVEDRANMPKWADVNVFDRIDVLAKPKPLPKGYIEEKECSYWISKKPPHRPKAGFTKSVATPRVEELAKPVYYKGDWIGVRHCRWEDEQYKPPKLSDLKPDEVNWERLATPKPVYDLQFNPPNRRVAKSALAFEATKRLHQLAVPKKEIKSGEYYMWLWNKKPHDKERLHEVKQLSIDKTDMEDARILLRCDLDFVTGKSLERKVKSILPSIQYAFNKKARAVIIISHCGYPNGERDPELSLEKIMDLLSEALPNNHVVFLDNCIGAEAIALCEDPEPGHVFLLENLRFHPEELGYKIGKDGEKIPCTPESISKFHNILLSFGDVYVNEAFTLLDTDATTNFGDPKKERCYGLHVKREFQIYNYFIVSHKKKRLVAVIGGTYDDVADIICSLMGKAQEILLGGEVALMFLKGVKDLEIGETECSPFHQRKIKEMMTRARDTNTVINLPSDLVVEHVDDPGVYYTGHAKDGIDDYYQAVDIGPLTRGCYSSVMSTADLLIWHGPMGILMDGTSAIAEAFGNATKEGIKTYLLDETTLSYLEKFHPTGDVCHVTENSAVTMMLLHRKIPKSVASLTPFRKKTKKRPPKVVGASSKPTFYDNPCSTMCNTIGRLSIADMEMKGKKVVIRCDLDAPVDNGEIRDDYRIRMAVPTIRYALQCGAKAVIVVSCRTLNQSQASLKPVAAKLASLLTITAKAVVFVPEPTLAKVNNALNNCYPGTVLVVESLNSREEEYNFNPNVRDLPLKTVEKFTSFCEELSQMGDVYVNDTFNNLHLQTASTCGIMLRQRACGFLLRNELQYMSSVFNAPKRPILVIMGGNYNKYKIQALKSMIREVDELIITGSLAMAFLKVQNKMPTGASYIPAELEAEVPKIVDLATENSVRILYPVDFVVAKDMKEGAEYKMLSASIGVPDKWYATDIGDNSCSLFKQAVKRSKMIFWHGVAGYVENKPFRRGTKTLLDVLITVTQDPDLKATSIIGGNSVLCFARSTYRNFSGVSHISTGNMTCAALIKDRCLPSIRLLSADKRKQSLSPQSMDQIELSEVRVLLRAHMDQPVRMDKETEVVEPSCINTLVSTIKNIQRKGPKCITIAATLGNPKGVKDEKLSLASTKTILEKKLNKEIQFFEDGVTDANVSSGSGGQLYMLENLGFHPEEQGMEVVDCGGDCVRLPYNQIDEYRKKLAALGDVYINESFASLSSCDSSVVGVPSKVKVAGPMLKAELAKFRVFRSKMTTPLLAIVGSCGGVDMESKLNQLYDMMDVVTEVILCGDIAYSYIRITKPQAKMEATPHNPDNAKFWFRVLAKAKLNNITMHVPVDFLINEKDKIKLEESPPQPPVPSAEGDDEAQEEFKMVPIVKQLKDGLGAGHRAMDIGPASVEKFRDVIMAAGTVVLMGAAGEFEEKDYDEGTKAILETIREAGTENGSQSLAFGPDSCRMLEYLDKTEAVSHYSMATTACVNLMRNISLPGLGALDSPAAKVLKKLSIHRFNISDKRVLLRLDLDIPIVEGIVLDMIKIEQVLPTIRFLLDHGAKCVVMMGHRGDPKGYKNAYLSLEPLAQEFAQCLETTVNFLPYPCSARARQVLADPEPGSVFLMENLKFYPAEEGVDIGKKPVKVTDETQEDEMGDGVGGEEKREGEENLLPSTVKSEMNPAANEEVTEEVENAPEQSNTTEDKEEDAEDIEGEEENDEFVTFSDPENIDRLMYELMAPKSLQRYIDELSACGDIFVNDNPRDIDSSLTSMTKLAHSKKMCGLLINDLIGQADSDDVYQLKSIVKLTAAPKEGVTDDL